MIHTVHAAAARRRVLRAFRAARAVAPEHARTLEQLGLSADRFFRGYHSRGVIREVGADTFYLDEDALREYEWMVLRWAMVPIAALLALLIFAIATGKR